MDKPFTFTFLTKSWRFDPQCLQSVGWDFKPWPRLNMTLAVGGMLNKNEQNTRY